MQTNIYYADPDVSRLDTSIVQVTDLGAQFDVAVAENIMRPGGGGEPSDRGVIHWNGQSYSISAVTKSDGLTWMRIPSSASHLRAGTPVSVELDADYRERRRRLHTGVHIVIRSCMTSADIDVTEADINGDATAARISIRSPTALNGSDFDRVVRQVNEIILAALPVEAIKAKSIAEARHAFGSQFRLSDRFGLSGRVRLIKIGDFDVNPCAGLHWKDTGIGPCSLKLSETAEAVHIDLKPSEWRKI